MAPSFTTFPWHLHLPPSPMSTSISFVVSYLININWDSYIIVTHFLNLFFFLQTLLPIKDLSLKPRYALFLFNLSIHFPFHEFSLFLDSCFLVFIHPLTNHYTFLALTDIDLLVTPRNLYRYKLGKIIMTRICIGISYGK